MAAIGAKRTFGEMPTSAKCCHERTHAVPQTTPPLDHLVGNRLLNNGVSLHDRQRFANFWKQPIETSEYQAVEDAERESLRSSPPQNVYCCRNVQISAWSAARTRQHRPILDQPPTRMRFPIRTAYSRIRIDQLLMLGAVLREKIDKGSHLRRQMVTMRINRVHRKFHRPVFGQETNQAARL